MTNATSKREHHRELSILFDIFTEEIERVLPEHYKQPIVFFEGKDDSQILLRVIFHVREGLRKVDSQWSRQELLAENLDRRIVGSEIPVEDHETQRQRIDRLKESERPTEVIGLLMLGFNYLVRIENLDQRLQQRLTSLIERTAKIREAVNVFQDVIFGEISVSEDSDVVLSEQLTQAGVPRLEEVSRNLELAAKEARADLIKQDSEAYLFDLATSLAPSIVGKKIFRFHWLFDGELHLGEITLS